MAKINTKKRNHAAVLPLCVVMVVILLVLGLAVLSLGFHSRLQTTRTTAQIAARTAADAGHNRAFFKLNKMVIEGGSDLPQQLSAFTLPGNQQSYTFTVSDAAAYAYDITAVGTYGAARKTITSRAVLRAPFDFSLFGDAEITTKNNAGVDGYTSQLGLYGGSNRQPTSVGTNSTAPNAISLANSALLDGDVVVGPDGDPDRVIHLANSATYTGTASVAPEEKPLPPAIAPILPYKGEKPIATISASGRYDNIILDHSEQLTITGQVVLHITGDVLLDNQATLIIAESSSLMLYVDRHFLCTNGGTLNNLTKIPANCLIFSTATLPVNYVLDNNSEIYAAIYAPTASVLVTNHCQLFGSIVGNSITMDNYAKVHCDRALRYLTGNYPGARLVVTRWNEF